MELENSAIKSPKLPFLSEDKKEIVALMLENKLTEVWITGIEGGTVYSGINEEGRRVPFNPPQHKF